MKKTLLLIALGAAFLAVSLWVWLSNGKSAKAVKAKFRLGGAILTLTSMMAAGGCSSPSQIACYDPAPQNEVYLEHQEGYQSAQDVKNGDSINVQVRYFSAYGIRISIEDATHSEVLQNEIYEIKESSADISHTINVGEYVGIAYLTVFVMLSNDQEYVCDSMKLNVLE